MKQKYAIFKDKESGTLSIKEYAELDKGLFSLIFEETYKNEAIQAAIAGGPNAVISTIRTPNLYPIAEYAEKIADSIITLFKTDSPVDAPVELVFSDIKLMKKIKKIAEESPVESEEEEDVKDSVEIDDLLDDDADSADIDSDIDIDDD
ncbi:MAG: hypothetical protein COX19_17330 [Desulfobacterales bacterium CG23_combo_of_CG06-09_8_20_14_all_51_8]|nr:MAG: hypothetical protein COX19_17330 [Desulfobacterales bacterium CG23_combo_of_CG06-09_8_20_14_all_51_8]